MTIAPLPRAQRLSSPTVRSKAPPSIRSIAGRRIAVLWAKRILPLLAFLLLASVVLWPQIARQFDISRLSYSDASMSGLLQEGRLLNLRYHGLDERNRPYTITAEEAQQIGPERINLVNPKADMLSESGAWTFVVAENGVHLQRSGQLDLAGHVVIYRDTGVTLSTASAALDLKSGAAAGSEATHAEGPFGTLDAEGFAFVDKGAVIQFDGKSHLILNGQH